jgi:hypothetical protein
MAGAVWPGGRPDAIWERRWWLIGSTSLCVVVWVLAVVLVLPGHGDWSWPVFAWGARLAVLFAAFFVAPYVAFLLWKGSAASSERKLWARRRVLVLGPDALLLGLVVALMAATFDAAWILVAWIVLALAIWLVSVLLGLLLVLRYRRRQRQSSA